MINKKGEQKNKKTKKKKDFYGQSTTFVYILSI